MNYLFYYKNKCHKITSLTSNMLYLQHTMMYTNYITSFFTSHSKNIYKHAYNLNYLNYRNDKKIVHLHTTTHVCVRNSE